jgi:hypothetical protein
MIKELIKLATHLDSKGLSKEADYLDSIIKKANPKDAGIFQKLTDTLQSDEWSVGLSTWTDAGGWMSATKGAAMDPSGAMRIDIKLEIKKM